MTGSVAAVAGPAEILDLLDWKRRVFALYADVRAATDPPPRGGAGARRATSSFARTRSRRCRRTHGLASPGLDYYPYDPAARVLAELERARRAAAAGRHERHGTDPLPPLRARPLRAARRAARPRVPVARGLRGRGLPALPRRAGGGRPTAAGATCSTRSRAPTSVSEDGRLVLDFNFAYNPSCSYEEAGRVVGNAGDARPANRAPGATGAGCVRSRRRRTVSRRRSRRESEGPHERPRRPARRDHGDRPPAARGAEPPAGARRRRPRPQGRRRGALDRRRSRGGAAARAGGREPLAR